MRFVTKTIHAWLDYPVAVALIALPFLLGLGSSNPLALTISPVVALRTAAPGSTIPRSASRTPQRATTRATAAGSAALVPG